METSSSGAMRASIGEEPCALGVSREFQDGQSPEAIRSAFPTYGRRRRVHPSRPALRAQLHGRGKASRLDTHPGPALVWRRSADACGPYANQKSIPSTEARGNAVNGSVLHPATRQLQLGGGLPSNVCPRLLCAIDVLDRLNEHGRRGDGARQEQIRRRIHGVRFIIQMFPVVSPRLKKSASSVSESSNKGGILTLESDRRALWAW
jgi:hypothetical protein